MSPFETWRPVVGFEGAYEVSDIGRVRSVTRQVPNAGCRGGRMTRRGQIMRTQVTKGYRTVGFRDRGRSRLARVHRLVCEAFHGPAPVERPWALHRDGDSLNNQANNLYWGTPSENVADAIRHGTQAAARKTHCKWGHEFTTENTRVSADGSRVCRRCRADWEAERRAGVREPILRSA